MNLKKIFLPLVALVIVLSSCQKENDYLNNSVPVANAGLSQTITLPTNMVTVNGTGADADGEVVAYLWSQVAGPKETIIVNPGSPSTQIKDLTEGVYTFQLMVTDDAGATGVDTMKVTVARPQTTTSTILDLFELKILREGTQDFTQLGSTDDIVLEAWTKNGGNFDLRSVLKFDFASIPAGAKIVSANLHLYSYPAPMYNGDLVNANTGANNSFVVQQITSAWTFPGITWFNQPSVNTANQVIVPHAAQPMLDVNVDVTNIVSAMVTNNANYGFLLKLQQEIIHTSRIFVSGKTTVHTAKKPKLVVVYQ